MNAPERREWLSVHHGDAPLVVSFPHTGTEIPEKIESQLVSPWLARKDTDFWVDVLYDFAHELGATTIRTALSRTVIDVNRDPSGASLYPGQTTTGLCPHGNLRRRAAVQIRQRAGTGGSRCGVAPSISIPITRCWHSSWSANARTSAAWCSTTRIRSARACRGCSKASCRSSTSAPTTAPPATRRSPRPSKRSAMPRAYSRVTNGRFRGGWITRRCGNPAVGIHAVQMELAMRGYLQEPEGPLNKNNWPAPLEDILAARLRVALRDVLDACIEFANARRTVT